MQETSGVKKRDSQETKAAVASLPLHVLTPLQARLSLSHALQDGLHPLLDSLLGKRPAAVLLPKADSVIKTV